jgi:PAS domain S-box-containing protein
MAIISSSTVAVHDAPNQGWADDRAYEASGTPTYIGTKVVVDGRLYGTVCFVAGSARATPFTDADRAFVDRLSDRVGALLDGSSSTPLPIDAAQERRLLHQVFETSPSAIAVLDQEGSFVRVSDRAQEILGLEREEITGRSCDDLDLEITTREGRPLPAEERPFRRVKDAGESVIGMEHTIRGPDGSQRRVSVSGSPLFDAADAFVGAVLHIEDVTPRRRAEVSLQLFRSAVEQAQEAILILDDAPRTPPGPSVTYANPAVASIAGHDPEEVVGRSLSAFLGPETDPDAWAPLWSALRTGDRGEGEALTYRKDGSSFVSRWSLAPVRTDAGRITHWLWVQRDVTDLRQNQKRLLQAHDAERRRIDQEMHDQMGGLLTALQMSVELARMEAGDGPVADHLDTIEARVSDLATVTRSISRRLRPETLTARGLRPAVSALVSRLESRHDLQIRTCRDGPLPDDLPPVVEMTAYYVVQELLVFAARRATTSALDVKIRTVDRQLRLDVRCPAIEGRKGPGAEEAPRVFRELRTWTSHLGGELTRRADGADALDVSVVLPLDLPVSAA